MIAVPQRFVDNIQLHLIRNIWNVTSGTNALIMGIAGPPGEGKSYQCRKVLDGLGYQYVEMSTSDFGSALEAESAKHLCAKYVEASALSQINRKPYSVICDDIDVAIGQWSALTQYTVNLQYAIGELMHLCDSPSRVRVETKKLTNEVRKFLGNPDERDFVAETVRVPVFVTGNDFTKLYAPLLRDGRMTIFDWVPSLEEKETVVAEIMRPHLTGFETHQLIAHCTGLAKKCGVGALPVSFYAALKNRVLDDFILSTIQKQGWMSGYTMFTQQGSSALTHKPAYRDYSDKAEESVKSLANQSYLKGEEIP